MFDSGNEFEDQSERREEHFEERRSPNLNPWLAAAVVLLAIIAFGVVLYAHHQQDAASVLTARNAAMSSTMDGLRDEINALTSKLNDVTAAQAAAARAASATHTAANSPTAQRQVSAQSRRMKLMQTQLDDQRKQLKDTQDALAQARTDLEGNINTTRDQLNGSIARSHEELVALEQRGERNYYEFDIFKSKSFQRTGPISVSLRKADNKHRSFDMTLLVDDNQLAKHNVDLYEPIWITGDNGQLQIVVNKIDKNHVHGYVSAPKYPQPRIVSASLPTPSAPSTSPSTSAPATAAPNPQNNPDTSSSPDQDHLQPPLQ